MRFQAPQWSSYFSLSRFEVLPPNMPMFTAPNIIRSFQIIIIAYLKIQDYQTLSTNDFSFVLSNHIGFNGMIIFTMFLGFQISNIVIKFDSQMLNVFSYEWLLHCPTNYFITSPDLQCSSTPHVFKYIIHNVQHCADFTIIQNRTTKQLLSQSDCLPCGDCIAMPQQSQWLYTIE